LRRLLDEGFEELAANAHASTGVRVGVTLAVGLINLTMMSVAASATWTECTIAFELWSWLATRRQYLGYKGSIWTSLFHAMGLCAVTTCWFTLATLYWRTGSAEGAVCAVAIWLGIISFAQGYAYQAPLGYVIAGIAPSVGMMGVITVWPSPGLPHSVSVWFTLLMAVAFIGSGAQQMVAARRRYKQSQAELAKSESGYRLLADNVGDVIALTSTDGRRLFTSPSVSRLMGRTAEELAAEPAYKYLHPDDASAVHEVVASLLSGGPEVTFEYRLQRKSGEYVWCESTMSVVNDGSGNIISISREITQRRKLQAELMQAAADAKGAAAAKSDFLANMTHELRTPLNAIVGFSGILRDSKDLTDRDARHVSLIHDASEGLLSVVNDVLDFSKLESGAYELDPHPFDPASLAQSVSALVGQQAAAKGLTLAVTVDGETGLLVGDGARLRQVMLNFLSNAVKFTSQGRVEVRLTQKPAGERRALRIEVKDSGIGIPEDQIEQVFERFTQADATVSRKFGGTGLGLAISKRIIETMDGRIGCDSVQGMGSIFWFEVALPIAEALDEEAAADDCPASFEQRLRLLLVEDNPVNRELVVTLLAPFDVDIDSAVNGAEGVEAASTGVYDMILMDVQMPVMDGLTATGCIRALGTDWARRVPIIAMTANVLPEQIVRCREAGMNDHLGKPISPAKLIETLSRWAGGGEDEAEAEAEAEARTA
jgi:PAS domain S-box-containing protein